MNGCMNNYEILLLCTGDRFLKIYDIKLTEMFLKKNGVIYLFHFLTGITEVLLV